MKKKLLAVALCVCTVFSVAGCKEKDKDKKTETKYELGQYKGIEVDSSLKTVEKDKVDEYLESELNYHSKDEEKKEGVLEKDGKAKITYKSTVDGKEYKSSTGYLITLNDKGFNVDGVVDELIGKSVGEKLSLDLKLDEDFSDTTVAGKDIHFDITIEAKVVTIVPEFTDEFVKEKYGYLGLNNKDEFLKFLEEDIYISQIYSEVWDEIMNNLKMESYDSDKLSQLKTDLEEYEEYQIYMTYGVSIDDYLKSMGMDKDKYSELVEESAKEYMKQEILVDAIAEAENITVTDELYDQKILEYAKAYGFETVEEFESNYSDMTRDDFEYTILSELVIKKVCENVKFVDGLGLRSEKETATEGATGESTTGEATTGEEETTK